MVLIISSITSVLFSCSVFYFRRVRLKGKTPRRNIKRDTNVAQAISEFKRARNTWRLVISTLKVKRHKMSQALLSFNVELHN